MNIIDVKLILKSQFMNDEKMTGLKQLTLKPQDIVVCLKCHLGQNRQTIQKLSDELFISVGEVHAALKRSVKSRIMLEERGTKTVIQSAYLEFIVYGLKYAFPASTGHVTRGVITGISAVQEIDRQFAPTEALPFVWSHPNGQIAGISLAPLFPSVPDAVLIDPKLHKALALIDAIRAGAAREREYAIQEIRLMLAL
jgi:hypothetical protein